MANKLKIPKNAWILIPAILIVMIYFKIPPLAVFLPNIQVVPVQTGQTSQLILTYSGNMPVPATINVNICYLLQTSNGTWCGKYNAVSGSGAYTINYAGGQAGSNNHPGIINTQCTTVLQNSSLIQGTSVYTYLWATNGTQPSTGAYAQPTLQGPQGTMCQFNYPLLGGGYGGGASQGGVSVVSYGYLTITSNTPGYKPINITTSFPVGTGNFYQSIDFVQLIPSSGNTPPPPNPNIVTFFINILSSIQNQLVSILRSFTSYFGVPNLFSISTTAASNITAIGKPFNVSIALTVPSNSLSNKWAPGINKVINTQCASYVFQNSTSSYVKQNPVINMTAINYTSMFTYTPTTKGVYIVGASCVTSSTSYNGQAWTSWSAPAIVASANLGILATNQSVSAPPVTNINIFTTIQSTFAGIISAITSFLHNLGVPGF